MKPQDALIDAVSKAVTASKEYRTPHLKRALVLVWRALPQSERRSFMSRLDEDLSFIPWTPRFPDLNDPQLEEAARVWGLVLRDLRGGNPADIGFAAGIQDKLTSPKWRSWKPSDKQRDWMIRLWREWRRYRDTEGQVLEAAK